MLTLTHAQAAISVNGATAHQAIELPYNWDRFNRGQQGAAGFDIPFDLAEVPIDAWGLYFPRLGNAYEIWLNGDLLQRQGDLLHYNGADYSQVPLYVVIPRGLLRPTNVLRVHVRADVGRKGGLSEVTLGPRDEVYAAYQHKYWWRGLGSLAVAGFSLLVGLMALMLWLTQTNIALPDHARRDSLYLYAALAELSWTFNTGSTLIEDPVLAWPSWGVLVAFAGQVWIFSMILFAVEVAGWRHQAWTLWLRRWLILLGASVLPLATWALAGGNALALTLLYATSSLTTLSFAAVFCWQAVRHASLAHRCVAVALVLNFLTGLRDLYVYRIHQGYGENSWLRYSSILFGLALTYIVITRFRSATIQVRDLLATMSARVSDKEAELRKSYDKLEDSAREQERTAERARILRDMHDGVGSHISSAIRQLQGAGKQGLQDGNAEVLLTLRDALDQLKLSIDATHLPQGDITALLANLRYRLEPRFVVIGIALHWDVDVLPVLMRLNASAMRQLQFMLFEAMSNVLQHAQASILRIEAHVEDTSTWVRVVDNGRGFDVHGRHGKGLVSLRARAAAIGAQLHITSEPGNTAVDIGFVHQ